MEEHLWGLDQLDQAIDDAFDLVVAGTANDAVGQVTALVLQDRTVDVQKDFALAHCGMVREVASFWAALETAEQVAIVTATVIVV